MWGVGAARGEEQTVGRGQWRYGCVRPVGQAVCFPAWLSACLFAASSVVFNSCLSACLPGAPIARGPKYMG